MRILSSGVFAVLMTVIVSGIWAALLLTNLAHAPAFPWSSLIMALRRLAKLVNPGSDAKPV